MVDLVRFLEDFIAEQTREPEPDRLPDLTPPDDDYVRGIHRNLRWIERDGRMPSPQVLTLDEARMEIDRAIDEYINGIATHMLLVKALPGVGKTTAAVRAVEKLARDNYRVMYCGPRHNFLADLVEIAQYPAMWYEWLPRQRGDDEKTQTCSYADEINEWLNRGYEAMDFCAGVCGWDWVNDSCAYHAQKKRHEPIIFCQHQHAVFGHPLSFDYVFGDESPIMAFQHEWRIPAKFIMPHDMSMLDPLAEMLHKLTSLAVADKYARGPELLEALGGSQEIIDLIDASNIPASADILNPEIHNASLVDEMPYAHLFALASLLKRESLTVVSDLAGISRIVAGRGTLTLLLRHAPNDKLPPHVIWSDATANERLYRACFQRPVKVVDAQPAIGGRIYQLYERANTKTSLIPRAKPHNGGSWENQETTVSGKTTQAVKVIERISQRYENPVIISFQDILKKTELNDVAHIWFYAARGTNLFEDADATIILGTPQPSLYDLEKAAAMIFFERDRAFQSQWTTADRAYRFERDGQTPVYPVSGFWGDPDLQAVLWSLREAEIVQAAHRGRPVNHEVDIWLMTNIPLDELPPAELLTMRDVIGTPEGVNVFDWERIVEAAEEIALATGAVTVADMMDRLGVARNAASKYLKLIVENEEGWFVDSIRSDNPKGGPPRKSIRRG